jgi:hypothetical protein
VHDNSRMPERDNARALLGARETNETRHFMNSPATSTAKAAVETLERLDPGLDFADPRLAAVPVRRAPQRAPDVLVPGVRNDPLRAATPPAALGVSDTPAAQPGFAAHAFAGRLPWWTLAVGAPSARSARRSAIPPPLARAAYPP